MIRVFLILAAALPLFAGFVGPEYPLSPPLVDVAPDGAGAPRIASNGSGFLLAWTNYRGTRLARLDETGALLDQDPRDVPLMWVRAVASDGRDYLIAAWCGTEEKPRFCFLHVDARTRDVTTRGSVEAVDVSIASNGRGYLAVFETADHAIDAVPLNADGSFAGPAYAIAAFQDEARVASNGDQYFVAFVSLFRQVTGVLVSESGVVGERQRLHGGFPYAAVDVASDGDGFAVVWGEQTSQRATIKAANITGAGRLVSTKEISSSWLDLAVAWNGSRFVMTYADDKNIRAIEFATGNNVPRQPFDVAVSADEEMHPAVASNGRVAVAVWQLDLHPHDAVAGRVLGRDDTFVFSRAVPPQDSFVATNNHAAWVEQSLTRRVVLQRLGPAGEPLDGRGITVAESSRHQTEPAIGRRAIAWTELASMKDATGDVMAMQLDFSGRPIGPPRRLGTAWGGVKLAVAMDDFVIWHAPEGIVGKRAGDDAEPVLLAIPKDRWTIFPVVASSDAGFLMIWDADRIQAFTQTGRALGPRHELYAAEIPVWNGSEYVVFGNAWYGNRDAVRVHRFTTNGILIGDMLEFDLSTARSAVWTGSEYRLAHVQKHTHTLWITRFDANLNIIGSTPAMIFGHRFEAPVLTRDLLLYLTPHPQTTFGQRVVARRIGENASPSRRRTSG